MKKVIVASILSSMIIFNGCGDTTEENNCGVDVSMLSGDNPLITLQGDTEIEIPLGTTEVLADDSFCAYDPQDGDLSQSVVRTNNIDFSRAGVYQVTYTVEDSDGFTDTKYRTVTIVDEQNPNGNEQSLLDTTTDGSLWSDVTGGTIESFKDWYSSVCGQTFDDSAYNANTGQYNGTIYCSNRNLQTIDLSELSIFSTIQGLDLSGNQLTDIDFSKLGLNELTNNTKILISLNLKNNQLNTDNFDLFRPLHYLKNIDKLYIGGNYFNYSCDDLYKLRTEIFNNRTLSIDREVELNCPSIRNQ
jgi:hypothetical protein